jgi:type IV secretion system protein VirD4
MSFQSLGWGAALMPLLPAILCQLFSPLMPWRHWPKLGLFGLIASLAAASYYVVPWAPTSGFWRAILIYRLPDPKAETLILALLAGGMIALIWLAILHVRTTLRRCSSVERSSRDHLGSARFARWREITHMIDGDEPGFILGRWTKTSAKLAAELGAEPSVTAGKNGSIIRWRGAGSLLTFAPPGGGKTSSIVIPTLIDYPGPIICHDPKGENAAVAARARRLLGHNVKIINPFGIVQLGEDTDALNPFDYVRHGTDKFAADCRRLAGAVVEKSSSGQSNPHFEESAISIIAGVISFVVDANKRGIWPDGVSQVAPSLPGVFDFFTGGADQLEQNFKAIEADPREPGDRLARAATTTWAKIGSDEKGSQFSTIMRFLGCFGDASVRRACEKSTFSLDDLRDAQSPIDVFLCVPQQFMSMNKALIRVFVTAISAHIIDGERPPRDVVLLLDEMAALGQLDAIADRDGVGALTLGRSAGIRIWAIVQSLSQLESAYGRDGLKLWVANAAVTTFMNVYVAPYLPSFITGLCSRCGPSWTGLQTRWG